jgi:hypothetical protein
MYYEFSRRWKRRMTTPLSRIAMRVAYGASQLPRVAWFVGHSLAVRQLAEATRQRDDWATRQRAHTNAPVPDRRRLYADMAVLFRQDLANVEAGVYPLPADHDGSLLTLLYRSRLFFEDLPEIHRRRESGRYSEVLSEDSVGKRPRYYLQNFHFQSGGWMTEDSARRYDTQVEVLFNGTANATRRQALPQLHEVIAGRDQRKLRILDIGCGTGRFLDLVKQVWPRLPSLGLDLSEPYIMHAKRHLSRWSRINLGLQCRSDPLSGRQFRRGDEHFYVPRIAARGAPHNLQRMRPSAEARGTLGVGGFASARRRAGL